MAVALGTPTTAAINGGSAATTFSFVCTNQPLYVVVPGWWDTRTLNTVTFGGVGLTRVVQSALSNANDRVEIWRLLSPSASTANIVVTFSAQSPAGTILAVNSTGQDTGTPEGTAASNKSAAAGTGTGNLAVGPGASDLTIVGIAVGGAAAVTPAATGGTATEIFDGASGGEQSEVFNVPGAATQVSGTFASNTWAIGAIPLLATAAAGLPPGLGPVVEMTISNMTAAQAAMMR